MKKIMTFTADAELKILVNNLGEVCDKPSYWEFILRHSDKNTIFCMPVMDYDVAQLCAIDLDDKEKEKLSENENVTISPYRLTYYAEKMFIVRQGYGANEIEAIFSDLRQYDKSLEDLYMTHTVDACIIRAKKAQELAESVYRAFMELGIEPESLISPANVFMKSKIFRGQTLPDKKKIPFEAANLAYKCALGNWTECYTRGHFDHVYDMDINSAYASIAMELLDLNRGHWIHDDKYHPDATYGYMEVEASIENQFHPILYKKGDMLTYTPTDIYTTYINKGKYDLIERRNLGYATILDGWWFYYDDKVKVTPLKGIIRWLFAQKQKRTGMAREIVKRIINGNFYGKFLEYRIKSNGEAKYGDLFLSPWGAEIESGCQVKVVDDCIEYGLNPIHIAVDGVLAEKQLPVDENIGGWKLSYEGKALVAGTGLVAIENKIGEGDFSISYDWIMEQIKSNPKARSYTMCREMILSLHKGIQTGRYDEIGKVVTDKRTVDVCRESKRNYIKSPKNAGELLVNKFTSKAWDADVIDIMSDEDIQDEN